MIETFGEVKEALDAGKVVYNTTSRKFIYKQVPTVISREIVSKMSSLPSEMKGIVHSHSGSIDFSASQYNQYDPETGITGTWCPNCKSERNEQYILASTYMKNQ